MAPSSLTPNSFSSGGNQPSRSAARTVGELFQRANLQPPKDINPRAPLTGFEDDSRAVGPGCLFVAVRGETADGHDFIAQALLNGAALVVAERLPEDLDPALLGLETLPSTSPVSETEASDGESDPVFRAVGEKLLLTGDTRFLLGRLAHAFWDNPSRVLQVIGITGTNGKTTTAYLVESALRNLRRYPALFSTVEYRLGGEKREAPNTTPGAVQLARMMALALERDADSVVMEVSSHALVQGRLEGVEFDAALISNLTQDHLDYHGTMEQYAEAKRLLFTRYKPRVALFNLDDPTAQRFAGDHAGTKITYTLESGTALDLDADLYPIMLNVDAKGIEMNVWFKSRGSPKILPLRSSLRGRFNASNLLAAAAICTALGLAPEQVAAGLKGARGAPGRFESVDVGQPFAIIVDYAHTPDAVVNLLENVRVLTPGRVFVALGCGGDRDPGKRSKMGMAMGRLSDYAIITSDNPRSEDPEKIALAMEKGIRITTAAENYEIQLDRREAIRRVLERARPGDAVVIAGKGHEDYQLTQGVKRHFDDRETAREICLEILNERRKTS